MSSVDLDNDDKQLNEHKEIGAVEALWSFFSSMRTAIVLLLGLAIASIVGTVLEDRRGTIIYHEAWFSVLLALVGINLLVCSVNRFGLAWKRTFKPGVKADEKTVARMQPSETIDSPRSVESAAQRLMEALRGRSYKPLSQTTTDGVAIYAAKGSAAIWGPYLTHLSILIVFIGAIFGSLVGSDGHLAIMEGERADGYFQSDSHTAKPLGFEVALRRFEIKHDGKGNPTAYLSDLQIYDNGKLAAEKVIDVNHPLSYKGMTFYQSDYGVAELIIKVTSPDGATARIPFDVGVDDRGGAKVYQIAEEPFKEFKLGDKKWTLFVHDLVPDYVGGRELNRSMLPVNIAVNIMLNDRFPEYKGLDAWRKIGWVPVSKPVEYEGITIALEKVISYSGLQVGRNPGLPVVYAGFALMVLGVVLSFYVTRRIIRISVVESGQGSKVTVGGASRSEPAIFEKDFKRLRDSVS